MEKHSRQPPQDHEHPRQKKRAYFEHLARKYGGEMRLLFQGGRLTKKDRWRNVAEHCVMQLAAAEELCRLLHMSPEETKAICSTAAIHDWKKRWERTGQPMPQRAPELLADLDVHEDLLNGSNPDHLEQVYLGTKPFSFLQESMLYLDLITKESDIVRAEDRIREVEASPRSKGLEMKANGTYWQQTRARCRSIEAKLYERLREDGHDIASPAEIPIFIRGRIEAQWTEQ